MLGAATMPRRFTFPEGATTMPKLSFGGDPMVDPWASGQNLGYSGVKKSDPIGEIWGMFTGGGQTGGWSFGEPVMTYEEKSKAGYQQYGASRVAANVDGQTPFYGSLQNLAFGVLDRIGASGGNEQVQAQQVD